MRGCERAGHALSYAEIYAYGLETVREAYNSAVSCLDGFPGTEDEYRGFLEAMRRIEEVGDRLHDAALELAEGCGENGAWEAEDDRIERQGGVG